MKEIKKPEKVKDGDMYFVRRHGGWFRPGAHGYTNDIASAGEFTADQARGYMQAEGVTVVSIYGARKEIFKEMQETFARASKLASLYNHVTGFP